MCAEQVAALAATYNTARKMQLHLMQSGHIDGACEYEQQQIGIWLSAKAIGMDMDAFGKEATRLILTNTQEDIDAMENWKGWE